MRAKTELASTNFLVFGLTRTGIELEYFLEGPSSKRLCADWKFKMTNIVGHSAIK
jgi:hypothetical protein